MINGKLNGYARVIYNDGMYYQGQYKDQKKHGRGKYVYNDGRVEDGNWKNGQFLKP